MIYNIAASTVVVIWVLGAIAAIGALVVAILALYHKLFKGWAKKVRGDFMLHLWLYQAMRAWEREGNSRPEGHKTMPEAEKLKRCAFELIAFAEEHGYVMTIHTEPCAPLAMGNSYMVFDVRESRERYQQEASK